MIFIIFVECRTSLLAGGQHIIIFLQCIKMHSATSPAIKTTGYEVLPLRACDILEGAFGLKTATIKKVVGIRSLHVYLH
jgi:hypothetical protein